MQISAKVRVMMAVLGFLLIMLFVTSLMFLPQRGMSKKVCLRIESNILAQNLNYVLT